VLCIADERVDRSCESCDNERSKPDDRHEPPGFAVPDRRRRRVERRILGEDRLFHALQRNSRLDPELGDEDATRLAVDLERFGLSS
jgi:hypothetical protein